MSEMSISRVELLTGDIREVSLTIYQIVEEDFETYTFRVLWQNIEYNLLSFPSLIEFRSMVEDAHARLKLPDAVNPPHYQEYMPKMQWLEAMQYLPRFRDNPEAFKGAVELQVRKYLDRNGKKDDETQELSKALWYLKFLIAYTKKGGPIRINRDLK